MPHTYQAGPRKVAPAINVRYRLCSIFASVLDDGILPSAGASHAIGGDAAIGLDDAVAIMVLCFGLRSAGSTVQEPAEVLDVKNVHAAKEAMEGVVG